MERTWKPTTAGILAIIAGAIQAIGGVVVTVAGSLVGIDIGMGWLGGLGVPLVLLGIVAIVGGIYALKRRVWGLALAGGICALVGPWAILGILSIVFVAMGKNEFE